MPLLLFFLFFSFIVAILNQKEDILVKAQRLIMLLINCPFKIILNDYDFN